MAIDVISIVKVCFMDNIRADVGRQPCRQESRLGRARKPKMGGPTVDSAGL